jgi:hypothetical protein
VNSSTNISFNNTPAYIFAEIMKLIYLLNFLISANIYAGVLLNEILVDEFTDEESVALTFTADEDFEVFRKWGQIVCNEGSLLLGIEDTDSWHFEDSIRIKFRFDKNQPFERTFKFDTDSSFAYSYSEEIIFTVLDELRGSGSFIIQLEEADVPMRFTNIYDSERKVVKFLDTLVSKSDC